MASTGTRKGIALDFATEVALGNVSGVSALRLFGMNALVNNNTYDMWPSTSRYTWATSAAVVSIVSSSANDTSAGTGMRTVYVAGLDANYLEINETVTLSGTTPVTTVQQFLRISSAYGVTAGSTESNVGTITGTIGAFSGFIIEATQGQSHQLIYTVPAGKAYQVDITRMGMGRAPSSADTHITPQIKLFGANGCWRAVQDIYFYQNFYIPSGVGGFLIPAKTDVRMIIVSALNTACWGEVAGWLITL